MKLSLMLGLAVLLFLGAMDGGVTATEQPALRVCLLEDNLPASSRRDNAGFDLDTAKAVAAILGRPFLPVWVKNDPQIQEIESDLPLRQLARGECDAVFSVPGVEAVKRSPNLTVGAPYYGAAFELVGRNGRVPQSLEAVGDAPVAVQSQTIANFVLNARRMETRTFFSVKAALEGLTRGEAVAAFVWGPTAGWHLQTHPDMQLAFAVDSEPPAVVRWNEHVATRQSDTTLREAIDEALAQLHASGTLKALLIRYGIPVHRPFDSTYSLAEVHKLRGQGVGTQ